jgi:hypothetical protein
MTVATYDVREQRKRQELEEPEDQRIGHLELEKQQERGHRNHKPDSGDTPGLVATAGEQLPSSRHRSYVSSDIDGVGHE